MDSVNDLEIGSDLDVKFSSIGSCSFGMLKNLRTVKIKDVIVPKDSFICRVNDMNWYDFESQEQINEYIYETEICEVIFASTSYEFYTNEQTKIDELITESKSSKGKRKATREVFWKTKCFRKMCVL